MSTQIEELRSVEQEAQKFAVGDEVSVGDTGTTASITADDLPPNNDGERRYLVEFPDGSIQNIGENYLRLYSIN